MTGPGRPGPGNYGPLRFRWRHALEGRVEASLHEFLRLLDADAHYRVRRAQFGLGQHAIERLLPGAVPGLRFRHVADLARCPVLPRYDMVQGVPRVVKTRPHDLADRAQADGLAQRESADRQLSGEAAVPLRTDPSKPQSHHTIGLFTAIARAISRMESSVIG